MWMTYNKQYGKSYSPVEHDPNTYIDIRFFGGELNALRDLRQHPGRLCVEIPDNVASVTMEYIEQENRKPVPAWRKSDDR